jgi:AP-3 complex subunit mu
MLAQETPPVISTSKYYIFSIYRNEVFLIGTTTNETSPLLVIEFLHRVFDIFDEYFGTVEEATIKDNFSSVYQLLEEMMDFGYPLTTEPNALKSMIKPNTVISRITSAAMGSLSNSTISDVLPDGTLTNMPWRKTGVKYSQNEIYVDIIEELDSIVDRNGMVISSEVSGVIVANSRLSGVPDLTMTFLDPSLIDDCSFHPCVRYNRFERDRVVSFVPPDGNFELMKYRVHSHGQVVAPCYCQPSISFEYAADRGSINISIGTRQQCSLIYPQMKKPAIVVSSLIVPIYPHNPSSSHRSLAAD